MDLGQADARPLAHRAPVTGHRELKAAAERRPVDRRRGGERRVLEGGHDLREGGRHVRLRELRDVGAGRERGPAARDDEARRRRADRVLEARARRARIETRSQVKKQRKTLGRRDEPRRARSPAAR